MFFKDYKLAFRTPHDLSHVTMKAIRGPIVYKAGSTVNVENDIVDFYNLVALVNSQIRGDYHVMTDRDADLLREVDACMEPILRRMINYLTAVCIRECRHYKKFPVKGAPDNWNEAVAGVKGTDGFNCVEQIYETPDLNTMPLGELLEGASACFGSSGWGGAFGGKAWKTISDHTLKFIAGEISAEVFIDQAFSLQHNTTTVFNKSVIYSYNSVDKIQALLDLQADGLIGLGFKVAGGSGIRKLVDQYNPDFLNPVVEGASSSGVTALKTLGIHPTSSPTPATLEPVTSKALWTYQKLGPAKKQKKVLFLKSNLTITQKDRSDEASPVAKVQALETH